MAITKTECNLWSAFIAEAKITLIYYAYAEKALEEGLPDVAQILREVAEAETVHAISHLKVTGDIHSTVENLQTMAQGEIDEIERVYPRMIREAEEEGRPDAVATFKMAWSEEREHLEKLQLTLQGLLERHPELRATASTSPAAPTTSDTQPTVATLTHTVAVRERTVHEVTREKERISTLQRLREVMFGAQDGLVSTVAVVSSVAVATGDNGIVIIAGATSGLAGMVSMAAGSFLGSRAEVEVQLAELQIEAREIAERPAEELAELIEIYQREGMSYEEAIALADRVASDPQLMLKTMAEKELGLSVEPLVSPLKDSLTMGISFVTGTLFPMIFFFFLPAPAAVLPAILLTLFVLFLVGVGKGKVLNRKPFRSGLEVVGVGTLSAAIGYFLGNALPGLLGITMPPGG